MTVKHGRVRYWLRPEGVLEHDPDGTTACLADTEHYKMNWELIEALAIRGERALRDGSRGGYCEDCLRKLGLLW